MLNWGVPFITPEKLNYTRTVTALSTRPHVHSYTASFYRLPLLLQATFREPSEIAGTPRNKHINGKPSLFHN